MSQDSSIARFSLEFFHRDAILFDLTVLSCGAGNGSGPNHAIHDRTGIRHRRRDPRRAESTATALDDAAGSVGVSESFMVKAERGADTIQWGKVFQILQGRRAGRRRHPRREQRTARAPVGPREPSGRCPRGARPSACCCARRQPRTPPAAPARVLAAARLVLSPGEAAGAGADGTRRPRPRTTAAGSAARAAEIARRVLTAAGEAVPERPRATGEEAPHV